VLNHVARGRRAQDGPSGLVIGRAWRADRTGVQDVATCHAPFARHMCIADFAGTERGRPAGRNLPRRRAPGLRGARRHAGRPVGGAAGRPGRGRRAQPGTPGSIRLLVIGPGGAGATSARQPASSWRTPGGSVLTEGFRKEIRSIRTGIQQRNFRRTSGNKRRGLAGPRRLPA